MQKDVKFKICAVFVLVVILFLTKTASAQTLPAEGLSISPPIIELTLNPSQSYNQSIRLTNPTKNLIEVYPTVMNFGAQGESGEPAFYPATSESAKYSLANWVKFDQNKIALMPEQVVEWTYRVDVPADVEPGGHYGVVFFGSQPPEPVAKTTQVAISSMVGALILGRTGGEITETGSIEEFSARRFYLKPPIDFTLRVKNSGNVHFKPLGEITIQNLFGSKDTTAVNAEKGNVLPGSTRKFTVKWQPKTGRWWTIGRFSANLRLAYGESEKTLDGRLVFWVIPWWFIMTISILIIVVTFMIIRKKGKGKSAPPPAKFDFPDRLPQKKRIILRLLPFFFIFLALPASAQAQRETLAAEVNVTAQVDSPVSPTFSRLELNTQETLADPVNHPLLLTVTLLDDNQKPLAKKDVSVSSNRGRVDIIEPVSKISAYQVHAAENDIQKDQTNSSGAAQFRITSFVPGQATLKIMADNVVELPAQTIKFSPLPFPTNLVLSASWPLSNKEFTIYSPRLQEENLSTAQTEAKKIINPETKIKINFWVLAVFLLIIIGVPIFAVLNFVNIRKMRWMQNEQSLLLKKMFPPNLNRQS